MSWKDDVITHLHIYSTQGGDCVVASSLKYGKRVSSDSDVRGMTVQPSPSLKNQQESDGVVDMKGLNIISLHTEKGHSYGY